MRQIRTGWVARYGSIALCLMLSSVGAMAQNPPRAVKAEWCNLLKLRNGQRVEVVERSLRTHRGRYRTHSENNLTLRTKKGELHIPRESIYRIRLLGKRNHKPTVRAVMLIGGLVGMAIGSKQKETRLAESGALNTYFGFVLGALGGGIVGAAIPANLTEYRNENPLIDQVVVSSASSPSDGTPQAPLEENQ